MQIAIENQRKFDQAEKDGRLVWLSRDKQSCLFPVSQKWLPKDGFLVIWPVNPEFTGRYGIIEIMNAKPV